MRTSENRTVIDDRPVPLWVQGLVTGIAVALLLVTLPPFLIEIGEGVLSGGTTILVYANTLAWAAFVGVYVPTSWTDTTPAVREYPADAARADEVGPMDRLAANY